MNLSDVLNSINYSKVNLLSQGLNSEYVPYVINRCLSYFPDTLFHANRMNIRTGLTRGQQYQYYLEGLSKRKRFSKWIKPETDSDLETVIQYYGYSRRHAQTVLPLISKEQMNQLKNSLKTGGQKPKNHK